MNHTRKSRGKSPLFLTACLLALLATGTAVANSRNDENLFGPTGMIGKPDKKGITVTKVEAGSPARRKIADAILEYRFIEFGCRMN